SLRDELLPVTDLMVRHLATAHWPVLETSPGSRGVKYCDMPTTANGEVSLYYETFGADDDPVLLLVNGLGSQCINFRTGFCEMFASRGFRVVRFDNRDVGLSSHLKGGPRYTVDDMAR